MAATPSTSVRMPDDLRSRLNELAHQTGQTRNDLIITALSQFVERELRELAMIQEGFEQIDRGESFTLAEVVDDFATRGMLNRDAYNREREQRTTT